MNKQKLIQNYLPHPATTNSSTAISTPTFGVTGQTKNECL
jgi:hypothetical protein